jgi:hypothetical protein
MPVDHTITCPQCGLPLREVFYPAWSYLNRDQWSAVRAGALRTTVP